MVQASGLGGVLDLVFYFKQPKGQRCLQSIKLGTKLAIFSVSASANFSFFLCHRTTFVVSIVEQKV